MGEPHALARVAIMRRHSAGIAPVCGRSSGSEKGAAKKVKGCGNRTLGDRMKPFLPQLKNILSGD